MNDVALTKWARPDSGRLMASAPLNAVRQTLSGGDLRLSKSQVVTASLAKYRKVPRAKPRSVSLIRIQM